MIFDLTVGITSLALSLIGAWLMATPATEFDKQRQWVLGRLSSWPRVVITNFLAFTLVAIFAALPTAIVMVFSQDPAVHTGGTIMILAAASGSVIGLIIRGSRHILQRLGNQRS